MNEWSTNLPIGTRPCAHPGCKIPNGLPRPDARCICRDPMHLYIPPGRHIHMTCPVHGDFVINGGPLIAMNA